MTSAERIDKLARPLTDKPWLDALFKVMTIIIIPWMTWLSVWTVKNAMDRHTSRDQAAYAEKQEKKYTHLENRVDEITTQQATLVTIANSISDMNIKMDGIVGDVNQLNVKMMRQETLLEAMQNGS